MASCADIAAIIHADMCDDDSNGYSGAPRGGGDAGGTKTLVIDGLEYSYPVGSYDCSSSVTTAGKLAIQYTNYAGALDDATYTGNMREVFENSGLFYSSYDPAKRGDVYLNDSHHTAMCQDGGNDGVYGYDAMSQFSINENGGVYGGEVGDQTGREAYITAYRNYPWNATLHYNGNADASITPAPEEPTKEVEKLQRFSAPIEGGEVYRLYNKVTGEHFFTSSRGERDSLLEDSNWSNEGTSWDSAPTAVPVYRLYNPNNGDHFYTTDGDEAEYLVEAGGISEGINFVAKTSGTPVYRLYNPNSTRSSHMYTTNASERDNLVAIGGNDEGIAGYV